MAHLDPSGEALIWIGSLLFTVALVPQGVRTIRLGRADDLSVVFILMVLGASAATLAYWLIHEQPVRVWFGFVANLLVWGLVLWYRLFPRPGSVGHEDKAPHPPLPRRSREP